MLYSFQENITNKAFLYCLQIADSFFPIGGFNHSYGIETYVQEGIIKSGDDLKEFLSSYIKEVLKYTDILAFSLIHKYASREDIESIIRIDEILTATKTAYETKMASIKMGKTMLSMAVDLWDSTLIKEYLFRVKNGSAIGNHASVCAIVTSLLGIPLFQSLLLFTYNAVVNLISASLKLLSLGQKEAQRIICLFHDTIIETIKDVIDLSEENLGAFAPAYEIRCMEHERLYSRLFMS